MKMLNNPFKAIKKYADCFSYLAILTGFFLLLEVSFFIQCNRAYFSDFTFMADHMTLPWSIVPAILFFLAAQVFLHAMLAISIGIFVTAYATTFSLSLEKCIRLAIISWVVSIISLILLNQLYFPNSKCSELSAVFFNDRLAYAILSVNLILFLSLSIQMLFSWFKSYPKQILTSLLVIGLSATGFLYYQSQPVSYKNLASAQKPNIIIIGVDSLRPDFLGFFGHNITTPFIDNFLEQATVFSEATTPLARTFPSWISILTGEHPKTLGSRCNLINLQPFDQTKTIAYQLRLAGYETLFATDETRFSNIDARFGFEKTITPPIGLNDFLLGTFNDFPISNLIVNTKLGHFLFPYSYGNRPVYFTYDPNSFLKLIAPYIQKDRQKPLFLAIHFCLPHHPYEWADSAYNNDVDKMYEKSIERADTQLSDFYALLKSAHLLDHAIVVLLSDHGEALALSGDRITEESSFSRSKNSKAPKFYPASLDEEAMNQSAGHGTDVLGLTQYHTVLAVKMYGLGKQNISTIPGVVSLLDIKPTLLEYVKNNHSIHSLLKYIQGNAHVAASKRHIFIESDFSPDAIRTTHPETEKVVLEGIALFQINPLTARLTVRPSMVDMIIESKQFADIYDHWMLALYPQKQGGRMPILINLDTGSWTNDLNSSLAKTSPAKEMLKALRDFYHQEIGFVS